MDIVFILPYVVLFLTWIDEYRLLFTGCLFLVPLLDMLFYVEAPSCEALNRYWPKLCMWMWFPCMLQVVIVIDPTVESMFVSSFLYMISLNVANELALRPTVYEIRMADAILNFVYTPPLCTSDWYGLRITRWVFTLYMLSHERLLWHMGACMIALSMNMFIHNSENPSLWVHMDRSHYGFGNYLLYRLFHDESQLLPISHTWLPIPYIFPKLFTKSSRKKTGLNDLSDVR